MILKLTVFCFLLFFLFSCSTRSIYQSQNNSTDEWKVNYYASTSSKGKYKPYWLSARATMENSKYYYLYWFYGSSDFVQMAKVKNTVKRQRANFYYLAFDSGYNYNISHDDRISIDYSRKYSTSIPLSKIDSIVFEKIISIADSLKLKNFDYIRRGKTFKLYGLNNKE